MSHFKFKLFNIKLQLLLIQKGLFGLKVLTKNSKVKKSLLLQCRREFGYHVEVLHFDLSHAMAVTPQ